MGIIKQKQFNKVRKLILNILLNLIKGLGDVTGSSMSIWTQEHIKNVLYVAKKKYYIFNAHVACTCIMHTYSFMLQVELSLNENVIV